MKKKIVSLFLVGAMVAATAVGCGSVKTDNEAGGSSDKAEKAIKFSLFSVQNALYFNISTAKVIFLFEIQKNIGIFVAKL